MIGIVGIIGIIACGFVVSAVLAAASIIVTVVTTVKGQQKQDEIMREQKKLQQGATNRQSALARAEANRNKRLTRANIQQAKMEIISGMAFNRQIAEDTRFKTSMLNKEHNLYRHSDIIAGKPSGGMRSYVYNNGTPAIKDVK